ncbi:MAG: hypothetical protein ACREOE_12490 [Gemmatimonadales bacterium]
MELTDYELVATLPAYEGTDAGVAFLANGGEHMRWSDPLFGPVWARDAAKLVRLRECYGPRKLGLGKRQLGGRDLRRFGLSNAAPDLPG